MENQPIINSGYLVTCMGDEARHDLVGSCDDSHEDHKWPWKEYSYWGQEETLPDWVIKLADIGIAFGWEVVLTGDVSYFAYNFPTKERRNNIVTFMTGRRKELPHMSKKLCKELEEVSKVNETLYRLGVANGPSQS